MTGDTSNVNKLVYSTGVGAGNHCILLEPPTGTSFLTSDSNSVSWTTFNNGVTGVVCWDGV